MSPRPPRLDHAETQSRLGKLPGWSLDRNSRLTKEFQFPDFVSALAFVNKVGREAEDLQHHPDITLAWGRVRITVWTHSVDGLTDLDFQLARRLDALFP